MHKSLMYICMYTSSDPLLQSSRVLPRPLTVCRHCTPPNPEKNKLHSHQCLVSGDFQKSVMYFYYYVCDLVEMYEKRKKGSPKLNIYTTGQKFKFTFA